MTGPRADRSSGTNPERLRPSSWGSAARTAGTTPWAPQVARAVAELGLPDVEVARARGPDGARSTLWSGYDSVVVVDAVRSGATAGRLCVLETGAGLDPLPEAAWRGTGRGGTHAFGLAAAVELARALHRLPARVTVVGVEVGGLDHGAALLPRGGGSGLRGRRGRGAGRRGPRPERLRAAREEPTMCLGDAGRGARAAAGGLGGRPLRVADRHGVAADPRRPGGRRRLGALPLRLRAAPRHGRGGAGGDRHRGPRSRAVPTTTSATTIGGTAMNTTRRTGMLLALATAMISGVSVFVNGFGVKACRQRHRLHHRQERRRRAGPARARRRWAGARARGLTRPAGRGPVDGARRRRGDRRQRPVRALLRGAGARVVTGGGLHPQDPRPLGRTPRRAAAPGAAPVGSLAGHRAARRRPGGTCGRPADLVRCRRA